MAYNKDMKNIKITILILVAFLLGAFATNIYASSVKLIMVPEYIGNYKTVDLLEYVMKTKQKEDATIKASTTKEKVAPKTDTKKINSKTSASA